ncbi:hypothetical protein [Paracoccus sp. T5]|uniref:hypothetical protein n=1 Tax=Paracoccus sp. T5 TaxID=3402161 RepID=UPI003AE7714D
MTDIPVNEAQWNAIAAAEQQKIEEGLRQTGAIKDGDRIVPDPNAPEMTADTTLDPMWNPLKDACKFACGVAAAAAAAWCTANTAGIGLAACMAAAESARRICEDRC